MNVVLSRRERYIGLAVLAVLAVLVLDRLIVSPLMAEQRELKSQASKANSELLDANRLFSTSRRMNREWGEKLRNLPHDASEAESRLLNNLRDWGQEAGLALSSLKPERTEKTRDFFTATIRATGTGSMSQVSRFLWRLETANVPVRVTDLQITSRKEGTDDLSITLGISTIYLAPTPAKQQTPANASAAAPATRAREGQP